MSLIDQEGPRARGMSAGLPGTVGLPVSGAMAVISIGGDVLGRFARA